MEPLQYINIPDFKTISGSRYDICLSYQVFGKPMHSAPVVLVNHALTGNSNVAGENGWWNTIIGVGKVIDTSKYSIISFNIPGNGFDDNPKTLIENYKDFIARDIAQIFLEGLKVLQIEKLFAVIGGSLGGGIAWEMAVLNPVITEHLIVIASDWKATDWLIANCQIQEQFLINSRQPVHDARMHAMLCYRTPQSFKSRFDRSTNEDLQIFNVESWLLHHGKKLQERFQLPAYKLMNQLLKTIDVTKGRDKQSVLENIQSNIHIVGVDSDLFFTVEENRETQKKLALTHPNVTYNEINSVHGHDAFLIEFKQLEKIISGIFKPETQTRKMKVLKFGGKSLSNGQGLAYTLDIIERKIAQNQNIVVVVSARGNSTNLLMEILEKAASKQNFETEWQQFKSYQIAPLPIIDFSNEFVALERLFEGVKLLGDFSPKIKDLVLAYGELLSAKIVSKMLVNRKINAEFVDSRQLIKTTNEFGNSQPLDKTSRENVIAYFEKRNQGDVSVVTGFIGSTSNNETTTLGRNGSNYSAALLANYLDAEELQNYTHVNGIYTANPDLVSDAKKIKEMSFSEANELANFGATILHAKTIIPLLEKNINLRILNTFNPDDEGTLITEKPKSKGVTSLSVLDNVSLINLEGRGLLGKVGVDARIFRALSDQNISISIISQGSSERGIGLIIDANKATEAVIALEREFENDFHKQDVNKITVIDDVSVVSIIGLELAAFNKPFNALIRNQITPLLFNNTITGKNVSLVVRTNQLHKAVNVIHGEIFGVAKKINIAVFGHGLVGGTLINQILNSQVEIERRKGLKLNIFAVANSKRVILDKNGISLDWQKEIKSQSKSYQLNEVLEYAQCHHLENLIAVDNTASNTFYKQYIPLINSGFDLVSSNKVANTIGHDFYLDLRNTLKTKRKSYLYETTVGAGLPLIDTINLLHESGENITRIRGVFSGSLSYVFNNFSVKDKQFSEIFQEAIDRGFTEPDPRDDFSGTDVARKLLTLARELDLKNEFEDVTIKNLIPEGLRGVPLHEFLNNIDALNTTYQRIKNNQQENHVLRYVGDLSGDLSQEKGQLEVKLVSVPNTSSLGQINGSDAIFEIFTESYGEQPIIIQGAGAGAEVTARGVFGDILRLSKSKS